MSQEINFNISSLESIIVNLKKEKEKYANSKKEIGDLIGMFPESWEGNSMEKICEAFQELSKEFNDVESIIESYIKRIEEYKNEMDSLDKKYKNKIDSY